MEERAGDKAVDPVGLVQGFSREYVAGHYEWTESGLDFTNLQKYLLDSGLL